MAFIFPGDELLVVTFKNDPVLNETKSRDEGRPIYDEREVCEVRYPGDRTKVSVFPADAFSANAENNDGTTTPVTYAERFKDAYQAFRKDGSKAMTGTPLEELPFLTASDRSSLKAFNIYTAEQLQSLEGENLKALGQKGREYKNGAQAYIENASNSADTTRLARENEDLRAQIAALQKGGAAAKVANDEGADADPEDDKSVFDSFSDDDIREWIKSKSDEEVHPRLGRKKLIAKAEEVNGKLPSEQQVQA